MKKILAPLWHQFIYQPDALTNPSANYFLKEHYLLGVSFINQHAVCRGSVISDKAIKVERQQTAALRASSP